MQTLIQRVRSGASSQTGLAPASAGACFDQQRLSKPLVSVRTRSLDTVFTLCSTHEGGHIKRQVITLVGVLSLLLVAGSASAQAVLHSGHYPLRLHGWQNDSSVR